jgi:hypothetical protein
MSSKSANAAGCAVTVLTISAALAFTPWLLMFAVAELGHPFGFWKCVVLELGFGSVIGSSVYSGVKAALNKG